MNPFVRFLSTLGHLWRRLGWWASMVRPGFLVITAVACLLGLACAAQAGVALSAGKAVVTLVLALVAHAAANVLNDHEDARNGADAANTQGLFPFTGGSRLIQTGVVQMQDMQRLAWVLLVVLVLGGLWLAWNSGPGLLWVGLAGVGLGWAYSAPPLVLMSRGLGEGAVALAWALMVVGADYVQRGHFAAVPMLVALAYGLMIANILVGNAFPDAAADALVGKRTLAVRLGWRGAARLYLGLALLAHGWVWVLVWWRVLPPGAAWALLAAPLALAAAALLWRHGAQPQRLRPALVLGIAAAVVHGLALTVGLWWAAP
ncbi:MULTISPECIES: prenyltransferase [Giesbergeria]|uniref:Prenyltransferase n=1 Tax=Giesbergeria sinuosa TaxID=80883 RepID=A0ABV9QG77_9BURK